MTVQLPECCSIYMSETALIGRLEILKRENILLKADNAALARGMMRCEKAEDAQQRRIHVSLDEARGRILELENILADYDEQALVLLHRVAFLEDSNKKLERTLGSLKDKLHGIPENKSNIVPSLYLVSRDPGPVCERPLIEVDKTQEHIDCEVTFSPSSIHNGLLIQEPPRLRN